MIGFAMCGSFCTHARAIEEMKILSREYEILPILSYNAATSDTRFGKASELISSVTAICGHEPIMTINDAEPLGPRVHLDAVAVCPCTGNTLAKLANGISDTPVTMAVKAHLRSFGTVLIALASNDALSANFENIGRMMSRKNIFFVPMKQDDVIEKPHSLVADFALVPDALKAALSGLQLRPMMM